MILQINLYPIVTNTNSNTHDFVNWRRVSSNYRYLGDSKNGLEILICLYIYLIIITNLLKFCLFWNKENSLMSTTIIDYK